MFRKAQKEDMPSIIKLWQQVFGDEEEKIERWVEKFAKPENVFVACNSQHVIVAQLLAVPCFVKEAKGIYLYALATSPTERGKGTMTELMEFAEKYYRQKGVSFSCLVPANHSLFSFYAKRGYEETTKLTNFSFRQGEIFQNTTEYKFGKISSKQFSSLRKKLINTEYVSFDLAQNEIVLEDFYGLDGQVAFSDTAYCLFLPSQNTIEVVELFTQSEHDVEEILNIVCDYTQKEEIVVNVGGPLPRHLQSGKQIENCFAMFKPLTPNFTLQELYIRMVMEEF